MEFQENGYVGEASQEELVPQQLLDVEKKLRELAETIEKDADIKNEINHAQQLQRIVEQFLLMRGKAMKKLAKENDVSRWQTAWHDLRKCPLEADLLTLMADEIHDLMT